MQAEADAQASANAKLIAEKRRKRFQGGLLGSLATELGGAASVGGATVLGGGGGGGAAIT